MSRFYSSILMAAAIAISFAADAKATPLAPGATVTPQILSSYSGTIVASEAVPFTVTTLFGSETAILSSAVIKNSSVGGKTTYDFVYEISALSNGSTFDANLFLQSVGKFGAYTTNVYQLKATNANLTLTGGMNPFLPSTSGQPVGDISRTATGAAIISANVANPINLGETSYLAIVQTNASSYYNVSSGVVGYFGGQTVQSFAPVPEPTTLLLWGGVSAGLVGFGALKRRKAAIAK